ncbi:glycosyltransferase family protein [Candidatus Aerophobetes bacterium]|nr:glycosyltransferase family protein [Candidatus Aerophobetes bacterium]
MIIGAIIQARISSTRLPEKILKELPYGSGITVLEQVIRRLLRSQKLDKIVVATTEEKNNDKIVKIAEKQNVKWFIGSIENVLLRYYLAAKENNIDIVVRITSDCPCIDAEVIDLIIHDHIEKAADYTSNALVRTYPHGLDVEVYNFNALEKAYKNTEKDYEKEHVTPYIYKNSHLFKINKVKAPQELFAPNIRVTLDTEEDYALLCTVFDYLYFQNEYFGVCELVNLFNQKPWLKLINKKVVQKRICETLEDELEEAAKVLDLQDLKRAKEYIERQLI